MTNAYGTIVSTDKRGDKVTYRKRGVPRVTKDRQVRWLGRERVSEQNGFQSQPAINFQRSRSGGFSGLIPVVESVLGALVPPINLKSDDTAVTPGLLRVVENSAGVCSERFYDLTKYLLIHLTRLLFRDTQSTPSIRIRRYCVI